MTKDKWKLHQSLSVGKATKSDIADILELQRENFASEAEIQSADELEAGISGGESYIVVCRVKSSFAGYSLMLQPTLRPWVCGEFLAVRKGLKGRGVAAALIEASFRAAKRPFAKILVRRDNRGALKLYKRYGFRKIWTKRGFYSDGEDALVLMRHTFLVKSPI